MRGVRVGFVAQDPMRSFDQMVSVRRSVEEAWRVHGAFPPWARSIKRSVLSAS